MVNIEYKWSAHRANMWLECPRKFYCYLNHYPTGPVETKYINTGLAVHDLLEDRVKSIIRDPMEYAREHNVIDEMMDTFNLCVKNGEQFYKYAGIGIPERTIHCKFTTPKGRRVDLEARIDLIADNAIWDYKTGKKADKPEYKLQGQLYHFATQFAYPVAKFISLQTGDIYEVEQPPKDFIPKLADRYIDSIENNDYPAKQSYLCEKWCPYYRYCKGDLQFVFIDDVKKDPEKYGMVSPFKK